MENIIQHIILDVSTNKHVVVKVNQYDVKIRDIHAKIVDNGKPYLLKNTVIPRIKCKKNDGTFVINDCNLLENGDIHIEVTDQMTACAGIHKCELVLYEEDKVLHTMEFDINVNASVFADSEVTSSNEFIALDNALIKAEKVNEEFSYTLERANVAIEDMTTLEATVSANEETRVKNETNRESSEAKRQTDTATAISKVDTATSNANNATEDAIDATEAAIEATANTNTAIKNANIIAEEMKALIANDNIIHANDLGVAGGVATLDENGFIPISQIPGAVNDVVDGTYDEENNQFLDLDGEVITPESDKIYVDVDKRVTYRWSGSTYVEIGSSLALGETENTAFSGSRGLALEKKVQAINEYHNNIPASDIKFDNTNTPILSADVQSAIVRLSQEATTTSSGLMSAEDKKALKNSTTVEEIEISLLSTGWEGTVAPYTQTVAVTGLSSYNNCSIAIDEDATVEQTNAVVEAQISSIAYDENSGLVFIANGKKPSIDLSLVVCVSTSMNVVEVPLYITDNPNGSENISYDGTSSGLSSTNAQDAIDEVVSDVKNGSIIAKNADMLDGFHAKEIASNPNILSNPDFKLSEGFSVSGQVGGTIYIDNNWYISGNATYNAQIDENGLTINQTVVGTWFNIVNMVSNYSDLIVGETYTLSFYCDNPQNIRQVGISKSGNAYGFTINGNIVSNTVTVADAYEGSIFIQLKNNVDTTTIKWVKLEVGKLATKFTPSNIEVESVKNGAVVENTSDIALLESSVGFSRKNLLPYPYYATTHTQNGITWTDNGDGTITANGTATKWTAYYLVRNFKLSNQKYIVNGCPLGGSVTNYRIGVYVEGETSPIANDYGEGAIIDNTDGSISEVRIVCAVDGITVENLTFKPMIRLADITDDTWEAYKESVVEQIIADNILETYKDTGSVRATTTYEDGVVVVTRTKSANMACRYFDYILEDGKMYTFSCKASTSEKVVFYSDKVVDGTYSRLKTITNVNNFSYTFRYDSTWDNIRIGIGLTETDPIVGDSITFTDLQLEEGTVAHNFQKPSLSKQNLNVHCPFVVGTQTATTAAWTGIVKDLTHLEDGQTIRYWLPYNSASNVTLNLTLADGSTTGAVNCYWRNTTRVGTQFIAGSIVILTYRKNVSIAGSTTLYTGWWVNTDSDFNNYDRLRYQQAIKADTSGIVYNNIIVTSDGVYTHLKNGKAFDITYPILWAGGAISASATSNNNYLVYPFSVGTTQSMTLTIYKPIYIKGTLSGTTFTPISTAPLTQTIPTSEDGYQYLLLGNAYSTTHMYLLPDHPIFEYKNGAFGLYGAKDAVDDTPTDGSTNLVTSGGVYTALEGKANSSHSHYYAASSSVGGCANTVYSAVGDVSTATTYSIPFHSGVSTGSKTLAHNNGLSYYTVNGTTSAAGSAILTLGNNIVGGKAGNKVGAVRMYGTTAYYMQISATTTANRYITFPDASGTVALAGHTHGYLPLSGGTLTGHVNFNANNTYIIGGESTALLSAYMYNLVSPGNLYLKCGSGSAHGMYLQSTSALGVRCVNNASSGFVPIYASSFNNSSSRRFKENIVNIADDEAKKILNVNAYHFDYIDGAKNQSGCIAEEIEEIYPEICSYDIDEETDEKIVSGLDYSKFVPYLIKMIQIQQKEIDELKATLNS